LVSLLFVPARGKIGKMVWLFAIDFTPVADLDHLDSL
jgi:hypothetical protein